MTAAYRVQQFARAVAAWLRPKGTGEVLARRYLPAEAYTLFRAMPSYDRQHALSVLSTLQERGYTDADLLAAALLHDAGKTVGRDGASRTRASGALRLWHRVAVVLMRAFWPNLLERIGKDRPGSWRQPFFVQQHHAEAGAEAALRAGCSPRTAWLIQHHEDSAPEADDALLRVLQAADGMN